MNDDQAQTVEPPPKRPSGAQRRKDRRPRIKRGNVWTLIPQPHPRVERGKPRKKG